MKTFHLLCTSISKPVHWGEIKRLMMVLILYLPISGYSQSYDLTGYWQSDAGGCYQIRQSGNEIFWAGEPGGTNRAQNVFHGAIAGNLITGLWYDLPSNVYRAFASSLCLRIENNERIVKVSESGPYKGSIWTRVNGPCNGGSVANNPLQWSTVHEHVGCSNPGDYCKRYDQVPIIFSTLAQGYVEASYADIVLKGTLSGTSYQFQFYRGSSLAGSGRFNFSRDFKSFEGTFEDPTGHRGVWTGRAPQ